jgi:hypothetical protein
MKVLSFLEFFQGQYEDPGFELYIVKDTEGTPMYIGIARGSVWHRWFEGGTSHMERDSSGGLYGKSYIGEVIERRFPVSWKWIIELWTKQDCFEICRQEFTGKMSDLVTIEALEPYFITKYDPLYNVIHGGGRHEDPLTTDRLNKIYRDIFG